MISKRIDRIDVVYKNLSFCEKISPPTTPAYKHMAKIKNIDKFFWNYTYLGSNRQRVVQPLTNGIASTRDVIITKGNIACMNICFHFNYAKQRLDARQRNIAVRAMTGHIAIQA
jgi:hypothetical protein